MAIVQNQMFSWQDVESSSEILRFHRVIETLDDRRLIDTLERERKGRRNDNPIPAIWNSLWAAIIFQHPTISSLRRELGRNGELRQACGFDPILGEAAVPSKDAYSRFFEKLMKHQDLVLEIFHGLVERLRDILPDFGRHLSADGKAVQAWRKSDPDAKTGRKRTGERDEEVAEENGENIMTWFGYKLHTVCDATYELPLAFRLTPANEHESPHLMPMVEEIDEKHPEVLERTETVAADMGYDDGQDKAELYDEYGIAPLILARDCKQGRMEPLDPQRSDTIYLSPTGEVSCRVRPFAAEDREAFVPMQFQGFEKDRQTLKFRCPAAAFGVECENQDACRKVLPDQGFGRVVRVPLDRDRRLLLPIHQHSQRFKKTYKGRTSVERLFYRVDHLLGFEHHTIQGLQRMQTRMTLALTAMLALAVSWIEAGQKDRIRCLSPAA